MKKTAGICLIAAALFLSGAAGYVFFAQAQRTAPQEFSTEITPEEAMGEPSALDPPEIRRSMKVQEACAYVILEHEGLLVVYLPDRITVYCETNIRMEDLDGAMQEKVRGGITFADERELYGFLESYSS